MFVLCARYLCCVLALLTTVARGNELKFEGELNRLGSGEQRATVFVQGHYVARTPGSESEIRYRHEDREILREKVVNDGDGIKTYRLDDLQENVALELERVDLGHFELYETKSGGKRTGPIRFKTKHTPLVPAQIGPFIDSNWNALVAGQTLTVSFFVSERRDFFTFEVFATSWENATHPTDLVLKFKPANFVISAFVTPVYMAFDRETKRIRELEGRVLPRLRVGQQLVPLHARGRYWISSDSPIGKK